MQNDGEATEQRPVKPEAVVINTPQNENLLAVAPITSAVDKPNIQHFVSLFDSSDKKNTVCINRSFRVDVLSMGISLLAELDT